MTDNKVSMKFNELSHMATEYGNSCFDHLTELMRKDGMQDATDADGALVMTLSLLRQVQLHAQVLMEASAISSMLNGPESVARYAESFTLFVKQINKIHEAVKVCAEKLSKPV